MSGFDQRKYIAEYNKLNYTRVSFNVRKGKNVLLREEAKKRGISINQLIVDALEAQYEIDLSNE